MRRSWENPKSKPRDPLRIDGFDSRNRLPYCDFNRPEAPVNDPRAIPLTKTLETVPSGERREVFNLVGAGTFQIFQNQTPISVEVSEIFIVATAVTTGSTVQVFLDELAQTPAIPLLSADQMYSDSGFRLPIGGSVYLALTAGTNVNGFLRWRYT